MYRVGIIINENEASHSTYADTLSTLSSSINDANRNGIRGNSYHFVVFDRFNIHELFGASENNIMTFDGLFVATNAMSFENKIYKTFYDNRHKLEEYINNNNGIFISSQKKLSNGGLSSKEYVSVGFLPEMFDFYMFYRPEKHSSTGIVTVSHTESNVLQYPHKIDNDIVNYRCENNQFMVHRYRSVIIPKNLNAYDSLLIDEDSTPISHHELGYIDGERKLLLSSRYNRRIVISTMSLDWANHSELLCNILTHITKDQPHTFFVKKESEQEARDSIIDSYIIRANIVNIPYRVISENEISGYTENAQDRFIFSPNWSLQEIKEIYEQMLSARKRYFSIYHIHEITAAGKNRLTLGKYSNFSSIDIMKDETIANLMGSYVRNSWGKSIWTYSYIINLLSLFDIDFLIIARKVYAEIASHFTKKDETSGVVELVGNYDSVFNNTCKMMEIFHYFQARYKADLDKNSPYKLNDVMSLANDWMIHKIENSTVYDQDICYYLLYLIKSNSIESLDTLIKNKSLELFQKLLANISEEILSTRIQTRSSVDLSRIHLTLCLLADKQLLALQKVSTYIEKLEEILSERQSLYGTWKNISETAEITSMLLEAYDTRVKIQTPTNKIKLLIAKGIELLYIQYDLSKKMWADDLNTTAKAMYAIGMYDKRFNFSINDFLFELKGKTDERFTLIEEFGTENYYDFYTVIDKLEVENASLNRTVFENKTKTSKLEDALGKAYNRSSLLVATNIAVSFILVLIVGVLYANYRNVLVEMFGNWREQILEGFLGLVITVVLTFIYDRLQRNRQID